jgi:hypothetical protein
MIFRNNDVCICFVRKIDVKSRDLVPARDVKMDDVHGNYVIKPIRRIGKGGFGYVEEVQLQNYQGCICGAYARKVFAPQDPAYRDEFIRRFEREVTYWIRPYISRRLFSLTVAITSCV